MATLEAMLMSFEGYSSNIDNVIKKTYQASAMIVKVSGQTDNLGKKLEKTGTSAGKAGLGMSKLFKSLISIENIKKGMDIADEYTNTSTKLSLINDGLQTQEDLQDKVFAAAGRSRGSYADMANSIYDMSNMAGSSFESNDELIAFAELAQKSFKMGAAGASEQSGAMQRLAQVMSEGSLSGDDFLYIAQNAPMMADAIAEFTGKSKSELQEMAAEGEITSDIIKNAMFMSSDGINNKFETMPMTFADLADKIKNHLLENFGFIIRAIAQIAQFIGDNFDNIVPVFYGVAAGMLAFALATTIANIANKGLTVTLSSNPIMWVALGIGIVVAAIYKWVQAVGGLEIAWMMVKNVIFTVLDQIGLGIFSAGVAISNFFGDIGAKVLVNVETMANAWIDVINGFINTINKIFGKSFDTLEYFTFGTTAMEGHEANKAALLDELKNAEYDAKLRASTRQIEIDIAKQKSEEKAAVTYPGYDNSTSADVVNADSISNNGMNVDSIEDEDLQYMRDIAERDYINQFSTATLAPSIQVSFGDVHEEADANKVAGSIKRILQEEIVMAAEGVYS